jgi:hypothetical protein
MDQIRLSEKNLIKIDIKDKQVSISRNKETIKRLSNIQEHQSFYRKQIDKLNEKIKEDEQKIIEYEEKLIQISNGLLDDELMDRRIVNNDKMKKRDDISSKKVIEKNEKKDEDKKILDNEYKNFRKNDGTSEYSLNKETNKFFDNNNKIPDYMKQNLKDMPSNKGYIWKNILCFGELPKESDNLILFEKCRNNILKIHEISYDRHLIYEKNGKNQKELISNIERKHI